jgi:hypothetical protein
MTDEPDEAVLFAIERLGTNKKRDDALIRLALSTYVDEPCRICGKPITWQDIETGVVFAGYSDDLSSRSAHKACWEARDDCST